MLVLSRKKTEQLLIGEGANQVVVTLLDIRGPNLIRIGVEAPKEMVVVRGELKGSSKIAPAFIEDED